MSGLDLSHRQSGHPPFEKASARTVDAVSTSSSGAPNQRRRASKGMKAHTCKLSNLPDRNLHLFGGHGERLESERENGTMPENG